MNSLAHNENELNGLDCHRSVSFSAPCGFCRLGCKCPNTGNALSAVLNVQTFCATCIQIVHGVKVAIESEVRGTLQRLNIYGGCKSRTTNFCEKSSCRCYSLLKCTVHTTQCRVHNTVQIANFTVHSSKCKVQSAEWRCRCWETEASSAGSSFLGSEVQLKFVQTLFEPTCPAPSCSSILIKSQ